MNPRITILREQSLAVKPFIDIERAKLITEAYQTYQGKVPVPILRALVFKHLLENKTITIEPDELIVGERGSSPAATPTYPELCCHTLEDFDIIEQRERISFQVSPEARKIQKEVIIPFWQERSIRHQLFSLMGQSWLDSYEAGIFTEFMEQRAPGHTVADGKIYREGFLSLQKRIEDAIHRLDFKNDNQAFNKLNQLKAMSICADALINLAHRYAQLAEELAGKEEDVVRKKELLTIAEVCRQVPAHAPRNFREALQMYWFVHIGVTSELNTWDSFSPGHLDQHLLPFYKQDLESGALNRENARELLQCLWIKFNNQPAPPKVGITLAESGTYTDFANINNGGLTASGEDGVNEVTYLILEVIDEMQLLQPSTNIQLSQKSPDLFLRRACEIIRKGWGQPSVFNSELVVAELLRQGKSLEDAREGGTSGCVETGAFGKEAYILTGYFNLVKVLEVTLHNGQDPKSGKQIGIASGDPRTFTNYDELFAAFRKQLHHFIEIKIKGNQIIEQLYATTMPAPFLSLIIDDCITRGMDYNAGGARYNTSYLQGVGIGSITDSLTSLKYNIFDRKNISMNTLLAVLADNFRGEPEIYQLLKNQTPKYGNDNDYADTVMQEVFAAFYEEVEGRSNTKGGKYCINMLPTTCHVYFGSVVGATPDGRKAGEPLSEGISPVQGADRDGPTAVIKSAAKMDQVKTGGTLLNQKFTPSLLEEEKGLESLAHLIRAYFKLGGHHIQFNVVKADTLRAAQQNPEDYQNLIVRVAGYSDYFNNLSKTLQDEIISRTEHSDY
ncbi:MAG: glycyl radical protein [Candidatus Atribacteria bacterium]|mgnify:CR=1 FL=1|nr:glycyl radical protein [Candidatus Atribacteria bacterium]